MRAGDFIPRITFEQAAKEFADHGYTLIDHDVMVTKKMAYICNKHPDMTPQYIDLSHLRRGQGCKYCRAGRRSNHSIDESVVISLCDERNFKYMGIGSDGVKTIISFICSKHEDKGIQKMNLQTLRKCHGCKYCAGRGRTTDSLIKDLNNPNIEILGEYQYSNSHIKCKCKIDGTVWDSTPYRLLAGQGCPICGRILSATNRRKTTKSFNNEVAMKNPTVEPIGEYPGIFNKMQFRCKMCSYIWETTPDRIINAKCKCPICTHKRAVKNMTKTNEQFLKELAIVNPDLEPLEPYKTDHEKIQVRCKRHDFTWYAAPNKILHKRTGCPKCIAYNNEKEIISILERWGYKVESQKRFDDCRDKNTLPFDLYIPEVNVLIEYDGEQHYQPILYKGMNNIKDAVASHQTTMKHDLIKTEFCKAHLIPLIRVPYWEADNMESFLFDEMVRCGAIEELSVA